MTKGEVWYIKRPGAITLIKAIIEDVTDKTICIREIDTKTYLGCELPSERYKIGYLEFVEKLEAT